MKWNDDASLCFVRSPSPFRDTAAPRRVKEDVLLNWLKSGLPLRLRDQANLISGSFDVVASLLRRLSTAAQVRCKHVREVAEDAVSNSSRPSPSGGFAHVNCYLCGKKGHMACYCEEKRAARLKKGPASTVAGEGRGSCPFAAGAAPKEVQKPAEVRRK